jgi:hypothetical protein
MAPGLGRLCQGGESGKPGEGTPTPLFSVKSVENHGKEGGMISRVAKEFARI